MASFDEAIRFVLRNEDPHLSGIVTEDPGGRTRFGIAEHFHPELGEGFYGAPAEAALQAAREIYRIDYWRPIRGDELRDQGIATKLLDMAVNMGVRQAVVLCQRALNLNAVLRITEDGMLGPRTLEAINRSDATTLAAHLREASCAFYQHLAAVRPESQQYLRGWLARALA
jgi:lysozyme family protein